MALRVGSLFSGIGGIDLGLERAGMTVAFQVEIDAYATRVLARHWPDVPRFGDIRDVDPALLPACDILAGGFPCQDISNAGHRAGIDGTRSGLWAEYVRLIRALRPRYVLVENVAALLGRGMGTVLGDLAAGGYDAEWECLPAAAFGAPHLRNRIWIVAYSHGQREVSQHPDAGHGRTLAPQAGEPIGSGCGSYVADAQEHGRRTGRAGRSAGDSAGQTEHAFGDVADAHPGRRPGWAGAQRPAGWAQSADGGGPLADPDRQGLAVGEIFGRHPRSQFQAAQRDGRAFWAVEPAVGRVADGIPRRVDRLRGLGNAVVPQVVEYIGRLIVAAEEG